MDIKDLDNLLYCALKTLHPKAVTCQLSDLRPPPEGAVLLVSRNGEVEMHNIADLDDLVPATHAVLCALGWIPASEEEEA